MQQSVQRSVFRSSVDAYLYRGCETTRNPICLGQRTRASAHGFEDATRFLFAGEEPDFADRMGAWPPDVRRHALELATGPCPLRAHQGAEPTDRRPPDARLWERPLGVILRLSLKPCRTSAYLLFERRRGQTALGQIESFAAH
ncbi:DUF2239 family protein [Methylobacterium sp. P31]